MSRQLHLALAEPEIPQNTGNIARTCAGLGAGLHLIHPLGFEISDKYLRRAGLDYWPLVSLKEWDSLERFLAQIPADRLYYFSTKAQHNYCDVTYPDECWMLFGKETRGLPEDLLRSAGAHALRIPMRSEARSLNLSNAAAIAAYEWYRQKGFPGLAGQGTLTPA